MSIGKVQIKIGSLILIAIGTLAVSLTTMVKTMPTSIGPSGVTFWFIDVLALLTSVVALILIGIKVKFSRSEEGQQLNKMINTNFRTAFLVSIGLVTFLALKSLNSLSLKDVVLLSLVLVIIELFLRTRKPSHD